MRWERLIKLPWRRRRWRRWLFLGFTTVLLMLGLRSYNTAGSSPPDAHGTIDKDARGSGRHEPLAVGGDEPIPANIGFRKSLKAFADKDSHSLKNLSSIAKDSSSAEHGTDRRGSTSEYELPKPKFKIYVYDLPLRFNAHLTECVQANANGCYQMDDFGMGPELRRHDHLTYRDTHQLSMELIIHEKMLRSRHRTLDIEKADAFYVPFYAAMACDCRVSKAVDLVKLYEDLRTHLASISKYFGSTGTPLRPHFMTLGKIEREFWTNNCPLLRDANLTGGITFIGVEQEVNEELRKYFKRTNKRMIVAPYPSYGHFDSSYTRSFISQRDAARRASFPSDIRQTSRDVRVFMAVGSRKGHDVRVILKRHMTGTSQRYAKFTASSSKQRRYAVWYSTPECRKDMQLPIIDWMRHSVFCLQPPGDSLTRKSFYDAVMAGCIPVTFKPKKRSVGVLYPFQDRLDYERFTFNIPSDDVLSGSVRVLDRLRIIPDSRIADMQRRLADVARKLQYSYPPTLEDGDAFTMIVDDMTRIAA